VTMLKLRAVPGSIPVEVENCNYHDCKRPGPWPVSLLTCQNGKVICCAGSYP
ncbi:hypothetical protein L9F63_001999, partial [Diploptera punctata]